MYRSLFIVSWYVFQILVTGTSLCFVVCFDFGRIIMDTELEDGGVTDTTLGYVAIFIIVLVVFTLGSVVSSFVFYYYLWERKLELHASKCGLVV